MPRSRVLVMLGLATVVLIGAAWRLSASPHPARAAVAAPWNLSQAGLPRALRQQMQRLLGQRFGRVPARPLPVAPFPIPRPLLPRSGSCAVTGSCSLIPCVEFVDAATTVVVGPRQPARRPCEGRLGAPKVLRVSAP